MATSAEGKTAASLRGIKTTSTSCESCEEDSASLFCQQCNIGMCKRCGRIHTKVPATRDHTLKSITERKSPSEGSAMDHKDMFCSQHKTTAATMLCEQCSEMVCPSCAATHRDHKTTQLTSDIKALQDVNIRGLQGIISDFHNLGQRKGAIDGHSTLYTDALKEIDVKRSEIIDAANKYADSLKKDMSKKKSQVDSKLTPTVGSVTETMTKTDKQITMLNSIKTSTHRQVLLRGIQDTFVLKKLNAELMGKTNRFAKVPTIGTLLPSIGKTDDVKDLIKSAFNMSSTGVSGHNHQVDFSKYTLVGEENVCYGEWRFCDSSVTGYSQLVLVYTDSPKISIYNINLSPTKTNTVTSDIGIHHLAKVSPDQYVAVYDQHAYLLDDKFKVLKTKDDKYDREKYRTKTICAKELNTIIECCIDNSKKPYKLHVNEVNIKSSDFHTNNIASFDVDCNTNDDDIFCRVRDNTLVIAQVKEAYIVDLNTRSVTTHDLSKHVNNYICSVCLDVPGYILIGDVGSVHVYNDSCQLIKRVDIDGWVNGIAVVEGDMFVSVNKSSGAILQKYQQKV